MAKPSQAKTPTDSHGSKGSERRSASLPGAARPEFDPISAADVFSQLSSARPAQPVPPAAPKTDPDLVRDHEILAAAPPEPDSAPPSIPSAAGVTAEDAKPQGSIPVLPGHVIANRYEVLGILGEGGMGIVYRCRDQSNGQFVAIKRVIPPSGNLQGEYVMWFYKEARALAALAHPNIVQARDFGQLRDGSPFLAMELVSGVSLHELVHTRLNFPLI